MVAAVDARAYLAQLAGLLPPGKIWNSDRDTVLGQFLEALAEQLANIDLRAVSLLTDIRPNTTTNLIDDWERVLGLPDDCSETDAATLNDRRAAVISKLQVKDNLSAGSFIALAATFGVVITVEELDRQRAMAGTTLQTNQGRWRFVWWIELPATRINRLNVLSDVNTPLLVAETTYSELECRLRKLAPAHTLLIIGYS